MEKRIEYSVVDLGLPSGLKWADRNVGAATPEAIGDYFMYGSTTQDADKPCDWAHAPFNNGSEDFDDEYFNAHKSEWFTENGTLKPDYDAAHVIMGGSWRMPTSVEIQELLDGTMQKVVEVNGVAGLRFTSKVNGKSIFMPFAGSRLGSGVGCVGNYGYVWSSSLHAGGAYYFSRYLDFDIGGVAIVYNSSRYFGFAVRGVHE